MNAAVLSLNRGKFGGQLKMAAPMERRAVRKLMYRFLKRPKLATTCRCYCSKITDQVSDSILINCQYLLKIIICVIIVHLRTVTDKC